MTFFADLTPYSYLAGETALNVGWLSHGQPFRAGDVGAEVLSRIAWLCLHEPVAQTRGMHRCELCAPSGADQADCYLLVDGQEHLLGTNEIRVPGAGVIYAAPSLILHYVVDHGYAPPEEFVAAAERLPSQLPEGWSVRSGSR